MSLKPSGETSEPDWFKSSYSGSNNNDCVEVAAIPGTVRVRDSKAPQGPQLVFTPDAWLTFLSGTANG
jgi:hypothetical protein